MAFNISKYIIPELNIWINKILNNKDHITIKTLNKANIDVNIYSLLNIQSFSVLSTIFNFSINTNKDCFNIYYYINNDIINDPRLKKLQSKIKLYPYVNIYLSDNNLQDKCILIDSTSPQFTSIIPNDLFPSPNNKENIFKLTYEETYFLNLIFKLKQSKRIYKYQYENITKSSDLSNLLYIYLKLENENIFPNDKIILNNNDNRLITKLFYQWLTDHIYRRLKLCKCIKSENEKFLYLPTPKSKFVNVKNTPEIIALDGYLENLNMIQIFKDDIEIEKHKYDLLNDHSHISLKDTTGNYYICYSIIDKT